VSEVVGFVGMSHSPFATMTPPGGPADPGARFVADVDRVAKAVARLVPDAVVVIGPDHFHANFYDVMPPFVLGVEEAVAFGDFGTRAGPLPVARDLAWSIRDGLTADGFDLSLSYALTVDHGVVQTYDVLGVDVPLVPLVVNTAAPPLPAMDRCPAGLVQPAQRHHLRGHPVRRRAGQAGAADQRGQGQLAVLVVERVQQRGGAGEHAIAGLVAERGHAATLEPPDR